MTASLFPVILGLLVEIYEQEAAFVASGVTEGDLITDLQLTPEGIETSSVLICVRRVQVVLITPLSLLEGSKWSL